MKVKVPTTGISFVTSYLIILYTATEVEGNIQNELIDESLPTDKRYAMLSYSYGGRRNGGYNSGYNSGYNGYNSYNNDYYGKRYRTDSKPWMLLPDRRCYRQRCSTNSDCCMRYNKCDAHLKVCLDCWYGSPCTTSADCCQRFPYCNSRYKFCSN